MNAIVNRLLSTREPNAALTIARVSLAALMFSHGAWKLGAWGGPGYAGTSAFFTGLLHLPEAVAVGVLAIELAGSLALAAGAFTRIAAAGVIATMLGAIATVHWPNGFFMNWTGTAAGEGFELHLLALALAAQLVVWGGGWAALDPHIQRLLATRAMRLAPAAA
jgi:putative oxidoreductase